MLRFDLHRMVASCKLFLNWYVARERRCPSGRAIDMPSNIVTRRTILRSLMASGAIVATPALGAGTWTAAPAGVRISDGVLAIDLDAQLRARLLHDDRAIASAAPLATLRTDRGAIDRFLLLDHSEAVAQGLHGHGREHRI